MLSVNKISTTVNGLGTDGQVLKVNSDGVCSWQTDNNDVANWSENIAVSNINVNSFKINSVTSINLGTILPNPGSEDISINANALMTGDINLNSNDIINIGKLSDSTNSPGESGQVLVSGGTLAGIGWATLPSVDLSDWSTYPAVSQVDIDGNGIINGGDIISSTLKSGSVDTLALAETTNGIISVSADLDMNSSQAIVSLLKLSTSGNITGLDGQLLSTNGDGNLEWKDNDWYAYPADGNVNLSSNDIINVNEITGAGGNPVKMSGLDLQNASISNCSTAGIASLNCTNVTSTSGTLSVLDGTLNMKSSGNTTFQIESGGLFQIRGNSGAFMMYDTVDSSSTVIASTGGNYLNSLSSANMSGWNTISCNKINIENSNENTYYVSPSGIDEDSGGSYENPLLTIQYAINMCEALTALDNEYRYIRVMPGSYSESLVISKKVYLQGMATSPFEASVGCQITGSISINVDVNGTDMFNNCVNISGFQLGSYISFVSEDNSILNLENCYIYTNDDSSGKAIVFSPTSTSGRLRITNCQITSGGLSGLDPLIHITKDSSITMYNTIVTAKGIQNCLKFSGTATCDNINNCKFTNVNSSSTVPAIVEITSTNSATHSFSSCAFLYSSSTNKASNANASGILCNSASGNPNVLLVGSYFYLIGTNTSNYAVQDLKAGTANAMICLYYMNGASITNAFAINGIINVNKFQLTIVS